MANYGIKVSKPGYDVKTATALQQVFNSEKNCIKLSTVSGTVSHTFASPGSYTATVAHGFSFIPGFLVWFEVDGSGDWYFMYSTGTDYTGCVAYTDATNLNLQMNASGSSGHTIKAYYVVFADNAT